MYGDGNNASVIHGSISIQNLSSIEVSDLGVQDSLGTGVAVRNGGPFGALRRIKVTQSQVHGFSFDDTSYWTLDHVESTDNGQSVNSTTGQNGGAGVWLFRSSHMNLFGGEFRRNNNQGIAIDSSQNVVVDGVVSSSNLDAGVGISNLSSRCLNADASAITCLAASDTSNIYVQNSWLDDNGSAGVGSDGGERLTIRDNHSISRNGAGNVFAGRIGIFLTHVDGFSIEGNLIGNNGPNACVGVGVYWCSNGSVQGSNVIDNGHTYRCLEFGNDGVTVDPSLGCVHGHQDPCLAGAVPSCSGGVPMRFDVPSQNCENCRACKNSSVLPQGGALPPKVVTSPPGTCPPSQLAIGWLNCSQ
ncbi:MAG: right-handed parallel beta-helix repeat-containing protein [Gemmatimonadaceae bacterium]